MHPVELPFALQIACRAFGSIQFASVACLFPGFGRDEQATLKWKPSLHTGNRHNAVREMVGCIFQVKLGVHREILGAAGESACVQE